MYYYLLLIRDLENYIYSCFQMDTRFDHDA